MPEATLLGDDDALWSVVTVTQYLVPFYDARGCGHLYSDNEWPAVSSTSN